jgi:hypothetical protein
MTAAWRSTRTFRPSAHQRSPRLAATSSPLRFRPGFELVEDRTLLSTFMVTSTSDSGPGSLRQAILDSNAAIGQTNTIDFTIPGGGVQTISPLSPLPPVTQAVLVDGESQPAYSGTPLIQLDGGQAGGGDGLTITGSNVTIRGLDISSFNLGAGIHVTGTGATSNWIYGNLLGTDPTGTQAAPNYEGVEMDGGAAQNLVGTNGDGVNDAAEGNIISGDLFAGVWITGQGTSKNAVAGNFIGTDISGSLAVSNGTHAIGPDSQGNILGGGVAISAGASGNRIGADGKGIDDVGERNVIAGSANDGIDIYGTGTNGNIVAGNFIGTDLTGTLTLGIDGNGVLLAEGASSTWIGANPFGGNAIGDEGNVISGTLIDGVHLAGTGVDGNVIAGNKIGTDVTGLASLPNQNDGVEILRGASDNTVGGTSAGAGNLISNNTQEGVKIADASVGNSILENQDVANGDLAIEIADILQNFPITTQTADGQLEGWLGSRTPNTTFHLEFFASSSFAPNGSGQAERYLGSLSVTTDGKGQGVFDVPYTPPAGLPIITATATDPQGNTSEISPQLPASLRVPTGTVRMLPGRVQVFSAASSDAIALGEGDAGPLDPGWNLTLSVAAGTLTLSGTNGLVGSGNGTGTLNYRGSLSSLNAALNGLIYAPPASYQGSTKLSLSAHTYDAAQLQEEVPIVVTSGTFVVTTTADSGPGSMRQAVVDSNAATGGQNTIDFAIPGAGIQTIAPTSPLPPITTPTLLDGSTQPGFTGTPLIVLTGQTAGSFDVLTVGSDVTLRGLAVDGFAYGSGGSSDALTLQSVPLPQNRSGNGSDIDSYRIDTPADEQVVALVHAEGATTRLLLKDVQGNVLMQSYGQSSGHPDNLIETNLPVGSVVLEVQNLEGAGTYTLTTMAAPATAPFEPLPVASGFGSFPSSIVAGDFAGNGRLDLATANIFTNMVSVLLGNGDGTFQPAVQYAVGSFPEGIAAGDFNGDGHLDLAIANSGSHDVSVLLGNGDGTFQPQVTYAVGSQPQSIVTGDFNNDDRTDLAVTDTFDNTVSVLLGNGDGTFQPQATYAVGSYPYGIAAGDFNGDGHLDLAVTNQGTYPSHAGTVSVLLGNGDGTFQPQVTYAVGSNPEGIVAGDFRGDGHLDLATANNDLGGPGTVSVLLGNGDGTFQSQVTYAVGGTPVSIVAGDLTSHGHLDLAVANSADGTVSVLLGNGDGTFQPQVTYAAGSGTNSVAAGDFNGDGHLDLATANSFDNTVSVLLGNGDSTFQPQSEPANVVGSGPRSFVAGDFTGDGHLDLATANINSSFGFDGTVSVLLGNGDGTFRPQVTYAVGSAPISVVAGDFNGDGRLDLAVLNNGTPTSAGTVSVLLGNGDGTFQPQVTYDVGSLPDVILAGDFTGDGHLDLAVVNAGNGSYNGPISTISVLLGNGDGAFQPQVTYPVGSVGSYPTAIVEGDFTGDGRTDLAVVNQGPGFSAGTVSVLLGNGDGTFQPQVTYAVVAGPSAIVAGDFAGNGRLDLAVTGYDSSTFDGEVSVLLGNGDGTFQAPVNYAVGYNPGAIVAGEFNGDGRLDLAVADQNGIEMLVGNGDGTFQPAQTVAGAAGYLVAADFTGDGKLDLATANGPDTVSVLLGNGDGTFVDPGQLATTPHATPLVADVNGDSIDDTLVVDGHGSILYRQAIPSQPGSFEAPITVNPGNPSRDIAWVPNTAQGPVLASVDAHDNAISFYAYRNGGFVQIGSVATGKVPARIVAADLNGDGLTDLVVRNAGDGTLSIYLGSQFVRSSFVGPLNPQLVPPSFLPPVTLAVGLGVSDVQAIDTTGNGTLDLVVTNKVAGQVSILRNLGNGTFAPPEPYRAGTGLSAIDPASTPEVTSLEATAGVAAGPLTPGGPTSLVAINPGSNTIDVLAGLGQGRFADPVTIDTPGTAIALLMGDFTGNGVNDLAVLSADALRLYLGDGKGGFLSPTTYTVPSEANGLTVGDLLGNGKLDLLVGDAYGDVLVLLGNGDGTFAPYHEASQAVALAVADLTGSGSKDVIYADQGLDRVVVDYGAGGTTVLGDHATGLLDPGAVKLADLNGDGIPDLIVANSGSNNMLIYPGLGNGQFGPAINGGNGYFVGTNPVGITVANLTGKLPDLVVADKGSNQVSILLNKSQGGNISFELGPRLNSGGVGPVSTVVGHFTGSSNQDILVSNSGSNNVALLPGVGGGFFNDTSPQSFAVGTNPGPIFAGNFDGKPDLVTVNAGSNDLTLISDFLRPDAVTQTISSGGTDPVTAFSFSSGSGFDDLVVGNGGDGVLALFEGSDQGLSLSSTETNPDLPSPSALVYAGLAGGQVQFYGASEGREAAALVALSLGGEITPLTSAVAPVTPAVAQVVPLQESSLALVSTLLITTVPSSTTEVNLESGEAEVATTVSLATTVSASFGQSVPAQHNDGEGGGSGEEPPAQTPEAKAAAEAPAAPSWQGHVLGTDEAIERFDREHPDLSQPRSNETPQPEKPQERGHSTSADQLEAIETAIEGFFGGRLGETHQVFHDMMMRLVGITHPTKAREQCDYAAALALAATVAGEFYFGSMHHASQSRRRFTGLRERWSIPGSRKEPGAIRGNILLCPGSC